MQKKIKIKDSIYILEQDKDKYVFIFTATRRIKVFSVDDLVTEVVSALKCERYESDFLDIMIKKHNISEVYACINDLEKAGILQVYDPDLISARHSRQMLFISELSSSWGETLEIQKKITSASIVVFGVGGLGTWIVNSLYQLGVGQIAIVDPDIIQESNINRQLFFDYEDIGKYKVDVLKSKLKNAKIISFKREVSNTEKLDDIIKDSTFLVNCADFPSVSETTKIIDQYAQKYGIAYCVCGGYNMHLGMVGPIIIPGKTKTFDDFMAHQKEMDPFKNLKVIKDVTQTGNLGPIAGAIANIHSVEIFKYLAGKGSLNLNKFAEIDFMNFSVEWREF